MSVRRAEQMQIGPQPGRFAFVNVSDSDPSQGKNEDSRRKFVRSNAMLNYRQKEKHEAIKQHRRNRSDQDVPENIPLLFPVVTEDEPPEPLDSIQHARLINASDWPQDLGKAALAVWAFAQRSTQPRKAVEEQGGVDTMNYTIHAPAPSLVPSPMNILRGNANDPFDAYPIGGCARYNSFALHHCKSMSTFPIRTFATFSQ